MQVGLELLDEMVRSNVQVDVYTLASFINTAKQDGSPHAIATAFALFKRAGVDTRRSARLYAVMISALGITFPNSRPLPACGVASAKRRFCTDTSHTN
jgi:hypothetical protein